MRRMLKQATSVLPKQFRGGNEPECEGKLNNFAPKVCFTNKCLRRVTLHERVWGSYWLRNHDSLTVVHAPTNTCWSKSIAFKSGGLLLASSQIGISRQATCCHSMRILKCEDREEEGRERGEAGESTNAPREKEGKGTIGDHVPRPQQRC